MKKKIFWAMTIIVIVSIILTSVSISVLSYRQFRETMEQEVQDQTILLQTALEKNNMDFLPTLEGKGHTNRITIIENDGTVLYDNRADAANLPNHNDRAEVKEAKTEGHGSAIRLSSTMGESTYYYAVLLSNDNILRVANTMDSVYAILFSMFPWMICLIVLVLIFALFLSHCATKKILAPLNSLDLEKPTENDVYEELSPLLLKIHHQNDEIETRIAAERRKQREFSAVTENMSEGLIVLNNDCHILAVNQSALNLLNVQREDYINLHLLELNRNLLLEKVAKTALEGTATEENLSENGRFYEIHGNPVVQGGKVRGAVLLFIDITERQKTEKIRREFSANVSHELKTPLTVILGYAELMENGLVKSEDITEFSHRIHEESRHLLELIEDIMELSRLDEEDVNYLWETIDLKTIAESVGERLSRLAASKEIKLSVTGNAGTMRAVPGLMDELIYNLVDNAIKYSECGTEVEVSVQNDGSQVVLSVTDQGIGIPLEYQDRVFERFFRVDKSHSKASGGTGLGLAIVKHVVTYHNGSISMKSEPGKGTKITMVFSV